MIDWTGLRDFRANLFQNLFLLMKVATSCNLVEKKDETVHVSEPFPSNEGRYIMKLTTYIAEV